MKKYRSFLLALLLLLPFSVNASVKEVDGVVYASEKNYVNEYLCEDVKEHDIEILYNGGILFGVYDYNNDKYYKLDFNNPGTCTEIEPVDIELPHFEFEWTENNELYENTYQLGSEMHLIKTSDEEVNRNKRYFIKSTEDNDYIYQQNPVIENLKDYYELKLFIKADSEYDGNANYYQVIENTDAFTVLKEISLTEETYEKDKYYTDSTVIREYIGKITQEELLAPKEKTGLKEDAKFTLNDFLYHITFNNEKYFVFLYDTPELNARVVFSEDGTYQTFGYDKLMVNDLSYQNEFIYIDALIDGNEYNLVIDKNLNEIYKEEYDQELSTMIVPLEKSEEAYYFVIMEIGYPDRIFALNKYYLMNGANQKFDNKDLTFKFSGNLNNLKTVKVNDKEISEDAYTLEKGSTIVTLKTDYLKTLAKGTNTLTVEYNDGGYVNTVFDTLETEENPNTYDDISTSVLMLVLSILILFGTTAYLKLRKN